jgi:hypothetical protein
MSMMNHKKEREVPLCSEMMDHTIKMFPWSPRCYELGPICPPDMVAMVD